MASPDTSPVGSGADASRAALLAVVTKADRSVKDKLSKISGSGGNIDIADMFDLQMEMNAFNAVTETCSGYRQAFQTSISKMVQALSR